MAQIDDKRLGELFEHIASHDAVDRDLVTRAYYFAKKAHRGQKRFSGKPYFTHTYATALYLAQLNMDCATIAAGFLHDTIEDGTATEDEIKDTFGEEVLFLVQGVTKLGHLRYHGLKRHVESLRKLFVAMSYDIRVLIIKLADRRHNMETLKYVREDKQRRIALETLEIYAPLAHRLGMGRLKGQLEDLAFPYLEPEEYENTLALRKQKSKENLKRLEKVSRSLQRRLADVGIRTVTTDYRIKHIYSLYRKLKKYDMNIEKVYDIAALRVVIDSVDDCYKALGVIHKRWKPLPGRIKDYIASPKINGYQSLHTTIFTGDGAIVEIQIRTPEMHRIAEFGVASHVSYKESQEESKLDWVLRILSPFISNEDATTEQPTSTPSPTWIQELNELQSKVDDPQEFLRNLKTDFFDERVFAFTPKGEVVDLPAGATPLDFAFAIHSDIGLHVSGAKINGKLASLENELHNGDIVDIQTTTKAQPSRKWLDHAKTTLARKKIRAAISELSS